VDVEDEIRCCSVGVGDCSKCFGTAVRDVCASTCVTVPVSVLLGGGSRVCVLIARKEDHL
jgi:hypothetical protein